jgi:hypothetical protein
VHSRGMSSTPDPGLVEAVEEIVGPGGEADDVLREVLAALHERGIEYAALRFLERGTLVDGPTVGEDPPTTTTTVPVLYDGAPVGELCIATDDAALAERLATLVAPYVLVGWDTAGEPWSP